MSEPLASFLGATFGLLIMFLCLWMNSNWKTHTPEWREEKLIDWLKRPLPLLDNRGKILDQYLSRDWKNYPYLLVDAICYFERDSDEVIKWAIYYSTSDEFRENDEEYLRVILSV